jgi:hypothetical protein
LLVGKAIVPELERIVEQFLIPVAGRIGQEDRDAGGNLLAAHLIRKMGWGSRRPSLRQQIEALGRRSDMMASIRGNAVSGGTHAKKLGLRSTISQKCGAGPVIYNLATVEYDRALGKL